MSPPKSWREIYQVHPAADLFPMLPEDELRKLGEDIKQNGLKETVTLWREAEGNPVYLLDGRNRLAAMELVGLGTSVNAPLTVTLSGVDAVSFIISKNIRRRHLTKAEIADIIVKVVKADFAKSEMTSQSVARSFSPNNGKRGGSTKDAFKEKAVKAGKAQGVGKRNMEKAIAKDKGPTQKPREQKINVKEIAAKGEAMKRARAQKGVTDTPKQSAQPGVNVDDIVRKAVSFLKRELEGASMQEKITVAKAILNDLGIDHTIRV